MKVIMVFSVLKTSIKPFKKQMLFPTQIYEIFLFNHGHIFKCFGILNASFHFSINLLHAEL